MNRRLAIAIDDDRGPLGIREYPQEPLPRRFVPLTVPLAWPYFGTLTVPSRMTPFEWDQLLAFVIVMRKGLVAEPDGWPDAISDGLTLPCSDCGEVPRFDYHVTEDFWRRWVPGPERTSVVCLPCLDKRCGGVGLADALTEVQWTGTGHTVALIPRMRHEYEPVR